MSFIMMVENKEDKPALKSKARETPSTPTAPHLLVTEAIGQKQAHMEHREGLLHWNKVLK